MYVVCRSQHLTTFKFFMVLQVTLTVQLKKHPVHKARILYNQNVGLFSDK